MRVALRLGKIKTSTLVIAAPQTPVINLRCLKRVMLGNVCVIVLQPISHDRSSEIGYQKRHDDTDDAKEKKCGDFGIILHVEFNECPQLLHED